MNSQVEAFLDELERWQKETRRLRAILLGLPLSEELKWGEPCYTFEG